MRQLPLTRLIVAAVVVLAAGSTLAFGQEADLRPESRLQLPILTASPRAAFVLAPVRTDRLAWAAEGLRPDRRDKLDQRLHGSTNEWGILAGQPTTASGGGSRFGGPLLWALVITASATLGFLVLAP